MMVRFVDIGGIVDHYSLNCLSLFRPGFVNYKKGALDSQPQVIQFTSCLPMVSGFLRVLRLLPPLKLVAMIYIVAEILLKVELNTNNQNQSNHCFALIWQRNGRLVLTILCFVRILHCNCVYFIL